MNRNEKLSCSEASHYGVYLPSYARVPHFTLPMHPQALLQRFEPKKSQGFFGGLFGGFKA